MQKIQLSDHFSYYRLIKFVLPTIVMMIIGTAYGIVDGFFVSNYVGKNAFAALNLIMPVVMATGSLGFMIGTGGSALVAKTLGEGDTKKANEIFSMLVYLLVIFGILISAVGFIYLPQIAKWIGADDTLIADCVLYGRILLVGNTAFMLQNCFSSFLIVAAKPGIGLILSLAGGVANIALDFLLIRVFPYGLAGAAIATLVGQTICGGIPLIYFLRKNDSFLQLSKPCWDIKLLLKACSNGASEMVTSLSSSVVGILYNLQLIKFSGADGIAAYGVIMYVNFIFLAFFMGFSVGSGPIFSYHYGANHENELKNLFRKSIIITSFCAVAMTILAQLFASPLSKIFVGYDADLLALTVNAFRIYSTSFLLCGFNIFGSSFFTSLNDGFVSAVISFLRTLLLQSAAVLLLPILFGINGIWITLTVAEAITLLITIYFFIAKRKKYHYV